MIRVLPNVFNAAELRTVHELISHVRFADGRATNPDSGVKHNLQAPQEDEANVRIAQMTRVALFRHPDLRIYARPRAMARRRTGRRCRLHLPNAHPRDCNGSRSRRTSSQCSRSASP